MTKREAENYSRLAATVQAMGVSSEDFEKLLRIEKTLHRWHERECNGEVEVDEDTGHAWSVRQRGFTNGGTGTLLKDRTANREAGALRRLSAIMARYPKLASYVQGDPRGCALYVYEKAKLSEYVRRAAIASDGSYAARIDSCYSSVGVALSYD